MLLRELRGGPGDSAVLLAPAAAAATDATQVMAAAGLGRGAEERRCGSCHSWRRSLWQGSRSRSSRRAAAAAGTSSTTSPEASLPSLPSVPTAGSTALPTTTTEPTTSAETTTTEPTTTQATTTRETTTAPTTTAPTPPTVAPTTTVAPPPTTTSRAADDHGAADDDRHAPGDDGHARDHDRHAAHSVRALYFGTYDRGHPRNINAIAAMRDAGVEVVERQVADPRPRRAGRLQRLLGRDTPEHAEPRRFRRGDRRLPGSLRRAARAARRTQATLVFDAVLSLENEFVDVRNRFRARSTAATVLRAVDNRALRLPDLVVCGTRAEADYLEGIGARRTEVIFMGADEDVFCETGRRRIRSRRSSSPTLPATSSTRLRSSCRSCRCASSTPGEIPGNDLGIAFAHAGIVLGSFRPSRAIPSTVFAALATGAPLVTADTPAARELLDDESAVLVEPGDAHALADALHTLASDETLRTRIAQRGRELYAERASRRVLGEQWRAALDG